MAEYEAPVLEPISRKRDLRLEITGYYQKEEVSWNFLLRVEMSKTVEKGFAFLMGRVQEYPNWTKADADDMLKVKWKPKGEQEDLRELFLNDGTWDLSIENVFDGNVNIEMEIVEAGPSKKKLDSSLEYNNGNSSGKKEGGKDDYDNYPNDTDDSMDSDQSFEDRGVDS